MIKTITVYEQYSMQIIQLGQFIIKYKALLICDTIYFKAKKASQKHGVNSKKVKR